MCASTRNNRQSARMLHFANAIAHRDIWLAAARYRAPSISESRSRSSRPFRTKTGPLACLAFVQHAVKRPEPFPAVRLVSQPFRPQQIAQLRMGADDAERR